MTQRTRCLLGCSILVCLHSLTGCVALEELTHGVAMWPFLLGTEVQVDDLEPLRGTQAVVIAVEVDETYNLENLPVTGAEVTLQGPGGERLQLVERVDGVYAITTLEAPQLGYQVGQFYSVELSVDNEVYTASATAAQPLDTGLEFDPHATGEPFVITFPEGYGDEYDQVLVNVSDAAGGATWSNQPETAGEWLEFAASTYTPAELSVPGAALSEAQQLYGIGLLGAVRSREDAVFSDNLTSRLSGFTTGSGYALPLWTE